MRNVCRMIFFVLLFGIFVAAQETQTPTQAPQDEASANKQAQPASVAQEKTAEKTSATDASEASLVIPKDAKLFVASMPDGFDDFMKKAIASKKVPVTVVDKKEDAEFELTGFSETQKASTAKKLIMGSWHSRESASIRVTNLKSGVVAFAYSYNNDNSAHGKKSSAESCAKHLKQKVESGK